MDPITIMALGMGASALGGVIQAYMSAENRGANQDELNKIKDLYNQIKPPDYNVAIDAPPDVHMQNLALPQFAQELKQPSFNFKNITADDQKLLGKFNPDIARYIPEVASTTIGRTADMKSGRDAQLRALQRYQAVGEGEFDPQYQEMVAKAQQQALGKARGQNEAILQGAARRGVQNSGLTMANQQAASAQAMNTLADTGLSAASQSYQNRLGALASGASLGGQIQGQDVELQQRNADIINAFNQRMQSGQQNYENNRANAANNAQQYNLNAAQQVSNYNAGLAGDDRRRQDDLLKFLYNAQAQQQGRGDQLAQQQYGNQVNQLQYNNGLATNLANWHAAQRQYQNNLKTQQFNNAFTKANGQTGPMMGQINMNTGNTQDINNAIQGIGNIGVMGAQGMMQQSNNNQFNANQANMAHYKNSGNWMSKGQLDYYRDNGTLGGYEAPGQAPAQNTQAVNDTGMSLTDNSSYSGTKRYKKDPWDAEGYA